MSVDFTTLSLGTAPDFERKGTAWSSPEGIGIAAAYGPNDIADLAPLNSYPAIFLRT